MSEDKKDVVVEKVEEKLEETVLSPIEEKASLEGWMPKENWEKEGKDVNEWRDAQTFIDRGELFRKIEDIKKENRQYKKTLTLFKQHHERVKDVEFKRALDSLKQAKKEALTEGDVDRVIDIDEKLMETREQMRQPKEVLPIDQLEGEVHPDFQSWLDKNSWYNRDVELQGFADSVGVGYKKSNPSADPVAVLKYVEERVRKTFPEKFGNPKRTQSSQVEGGQGPRKSPDTFEMTDEERQVMRKFVRSGALTEEQYIKDLKAIKGVKS